LQLLLLLRVPSRNLTKSKSVSLFTQTLTLIFLPSYKVYEVTPANNDEYLMLKEWETVNSVDHWDGLRRKGTSRVMVAPDQTENYEGFLVANNISHRLVIDDVEVKVVEEREKMKKNWRSREGVRTADGDFHRFWPLQEVGSEPKKLEADIDDF
jgi:Carboxypeptidase activation peptide